MVASAVASATGDAEVNAAVEVTVAVEVTADADAAVADLNGMTRRSGCLAPSSAAWYSR